jgi:hypothetical protein
VQTPHERVGVRVRLCLGLAAPCPTNASGLEAKAACACGRIHIMFRRRLTRVQHLLGKGAENGPGASGRACAVLRAWQAPQPHAPWWVNADSACGLTLCALCTAQCMLCQHHVWLLLQRRSTKWHDSPPFLPGHVNGHQPSAGPRPPIPIPTPCHGGHPKTWYPSLTVCQHVDAEPQQAVLARVAVLGTFWYTIA